MTDQDWNIEDCLPKILPKSGESMTASFTQSVSIQIVDTEITDQMLHECLAVMADVVTTYGDIYLPVFERLYKELDTRHHRQSLLEEAFKLSLQH